jgi:hypothetical protein
MLMDIPATISSLLNLRVTFPGKSVFDIRPTDIREREYFYYEWLNENWQSEYLPPLDEYIIRGSVFEKRSWRYSTPLSNKLSSSTEKIIFGSKDAAPFLGYGWSFREAEPTNKDMTFTWALGGAASLNLALPKTQVRLTANVRSIFYGDPQIVTVKVDGKVVGSWENTNPNNWERHSVLIENNDRRPNISIVEFTFSRFVEPNDKRERRLALLFESITLGK